MGTRDARLTLLLNVKRRRTREQQRLALRYTLNSNAAPPPPPAGLLLQAAIHRLLLNLNRALDFQCFQLRDIFVEGVRRLRAENHFQ